MAALLHLAWLWENFPVTVQPPLLTASSWAALSSSLLAVVSLTHSPSTSTLLPCFWKPSMAIFHHFPSCNALSIPKDSYTLDFHSESFICTSNRRRFLPRRTPVTCQCPIYFIASFPFFPDLLLWFLSHLGKARLTSERGSFNITLKLSCQLLIQTSSYLTYYFWPSSKCWWISLLVQSSE